MKKLIITGFDGTIADTSPGILYCMNTTAIAMGYTPVPHEALYNIIGVSLEQGFKDLYGMKEDEIEYAMNNNSKLYSMKGEEMILLYDGIDEALKKLKDDGYSLAIVTQKNEKFSAPRMRLRGHQIPFGSFLTKSSSNTPAGNARSMATCRGYP